MGMLCNLLHCKIAITDSESPALDVTASNAHCIVFASSLCLQSHCTCSEMHPPHNAVSSLLLGRAAWMHLTTVFYVFSTTKGNAEPARSQAKQEALSKVTQHIKCNRGNTRFALCLEISDSGICLGGYFPTGFAIRGQTPNPLHCFITFKPVPA